MRIFSGSKNQFLNQLLQKKKKKLVAEFYWHDIVIV